MDSTVNKEGVLAKDVVLNDADRKLYQHEMPETENDMGNMIRANPENTIFPNVAILDEPPETLEARYRRLTRLQPRINRRRLDVPDHITMRMRKEVEEFPLSDILSLDPKHHRTSRMGYILIRRASIILSPLSSFIDSHSDVIASIVDTRKRSNQVARTMRLQDNKFYKGEFALDYSFPKESAKKISISFAQEVPTFDTGEQWAVCQLFLDLEESDFPQTVAFQETIGQASLTTSMLQEYEFHPGHLDIAIRDSHRRQLRELYSQGLIVDETEPHHDKVVNVSYAKSSGEALKGSRYGEKKVGFASTGSVDWTTVQSMRKPVMPIDQQSVDPSDDGAGPSSPMTKISSGIPAPRKSSLKHPRCQFRPPTPPKDFAEGLDSDIDSEDEGTKIEVAPVSAIKNPD